MIITCPTCSTSYSVDPAAIGHEGKTVRCSSCANTWLQMPESAAAPQAAPEAAPEAVAQPPAPPAAPASQPAPPAVPEPEPEPEPEPATAPEPEPEPEPEAAQEQPAETAEQAEGAESAEEEGADGGEEAAETEGPALSQDDLDAMFGMDEEPQPVESLVENADGDVPSTIEVPEDLPDPEPIPEVFSAPEVGEIEEGKAGNTGKIIAILAAIFVFGIVIGAFVAKDRIIRAWPGVEGLYSAIGLSGRPLGDGLKFRGIKSEREFAQGVEMLVVRGIIANTKAETRPVPLIKVSLFDASNREVRRVVFPPKLEQLPPGENITFKARLREPPPTARRLEVTFTRPEEEAEG